jgi:RNA polymerase sigma factor (sigma-70 family)
VKPLLAAAATEAGDEHLVAAVRDGSDEAFEALYRRYRPRILAYVRSMCHDHARAEDVTQEAFMSALRGLRASDREIAFRPWLYEIAKNACIDHLRRAGRSAEVSIDSEDFGPQEEGRISQSVAGTDAEVARRSELESLRMAFGDLPPSQHEILVMRELEGLSYDRIGSRMGLSRGAVESMLFRARRTLREGFEDIDNGGRCERVRMAMERAAGGRRTGLRERRRLTTHLRDCEACRRTAVTIGLDELALAAARERGGALRRALGLLPLPAFLRRRGDGTTALLNAFGPAAETGGSLAVKAAAVVAAAVIAAGGAGLATKASGGDLSVPVLGGAAGGKDRAPGDPGHGGAGGRAGDPTSSAGGTATAPGASAPGPDGDRQTGRQEGGRGGATTGGDTTAGGDTALGGGRLGGTVKGVVQDPIGTAGAAPGGVVDRAGDRVNEVVGKTDQTLQGVTGGKAPRLPKVEVQVPRTGLEPTGSGTGSLPDAGKVLDGATQGLPLPAPGVQLPETDVTVPGTGLRLP